MGDHLPNNRKSSGAYIDIEDIASECSTPTSRSSESSLRRSDSYSTAMDAVIAVT
jgi:hypothetical protein